MNRRPRSRKKHLVNGTVKQVHKRESIGHRAVGENTGFMKRILKKVRNEVEEDINALKQEVKRVEEENGRE